MTTPPALARFAAVALMLSLLFVLSVAATPPPDEPSAPDSVAPAKLGLGATFDFVNGVKIGNAYVDVSLFLPRFSRDSDWGIDFGLSHGQNILERKENSLVSESGSKTSTTEEIESKFVRVHATVLYGVTEELKAGFNADVQRVDGLRTTTLTVDSAATISSSSLFYTESSYTLGAFLHQELQKDISYKLKILGGLAHIVGGKPRWGIVSGFEISQRKASVRVGSDVRWWFGQTPVIYIYLAKDFSVTDIFNL